ncbi:hypothetical protein Q0F98_32200 [Paenibacillus amylolyticus]|nr:hypothetical protein Q0F98_32200 [Paenibacillus amylolyticus]
MDNIALKGWIDTHKIIDRTLKGFWVAFNNYIKESLEEIDLFFNEFNIKDIKASIDTIEHKTIFILIIRLQIASILSKLYLH